MPVSPHCPHILQRRLQRFVTRSWTKVGIGRCRGARARRGAPSPRGAPASCGRGGGARSRRAARPRRKLMSASDLRRVAGRSRASIARRQTAQKRHLVAREHDAVGLRPVVALRLVDRALEGADLARRTGRLPSSFVSSSFSSLKSASISSSGPFAARISRRRFWNSREVVSNSSFGQGVGSGVPGATRSFHLRFCGSSSAVTLGSQGSTRSAGAARTRRPRCSTRRRAPRSDGRTRARRRTAPRGCRRRPCE